MGKYIKRFLRWQRLIPIIIEGERPHYGINFRKADSSIFNLQIKIPAWIYQSSVYKTWMGNVYEGRLIGSLCIGFLLRKWWKYPGRKMNVHLGYHKNHFRSKLVATREQIDDELVVLDMTNIKMEAL